MKAAVLCGNEDLIYRDIETPQATAGTVQIRVAACGICGSDVPRVFDHAAHNYPLILGHEFSGIVSAVGEGVENVTVGDHVVAAPLIPCMDCPDCRKGNYSLCKHYSFIGSRQNGAMADYIVVPAANVLRIPEHLSMEQAATIEPSTVALHALRICGYTAGKRVAVLGCGIIGLYAVQWAHLLGAEHITAISRGRRGLDAALTMGADDAITTDGTMADALEDAAKAGYDYVFECSGSETTMQLSLRLVANKGTVCFIGTPKKPLCFTVPQFEQINRKECIVTGSWMSYSAPFPGSEWTDTIAYMADGRLQYLPGLVHGTYPMAQAMDAFNEIRSGSAKGRVLLLNNI
ncbi:MAG: galactitol-1-phosphate 5-dehydrogenase [Clostridiales bacterium]|nr:galactitol-1-phosphate 5-dehydrogenase [Candidatus Cacconaster stercorequi]